LIENIIGHSEALLSVLDTAARAAQSESTILIHAETGTGKELLAQFTLTAGAAISRL